MSLYIVNLTEAQVRLFDGSLQLAPAGKRGYVKPLPRNGEKHREVKALGRAGTIDLLTAEQYKRFMAQGRIEASAVRRRVKAVAVAVTPTPAVPAPAPPPAPVVEESEVSEVEESEVSEVEESEVEEEDTSEATEDAETSEDEADAVEEEASEEDTPEDADDPGEPLITAEAFGELKADAQRELLTELGVEGDGSNGAKRVALYEAYLAG
jgi:hypothetical protein